MPRLEVGAFDHQQDVEVGVSLPIAASGDFGSANPTQHILEDVGLDQPAPSFIHGLQRFAQLVYFTVANGEGQHHPAASLVLLYDCGKCFEETGFDHHRPPPLTGWTVANMAEVGTNQF